MTSPHNPACFARHTGAWLMEPGYLSRAVAAIRVGMAPTAEAGSPTICAGAKVVLDPNSPPDNPRVLYVVTVEGAAVVSLDGPLMKGDSKFGGTNTLRVRHALRTASTDPDVRGILLYADTPGGHVAGTMELAAEVAAAGKIMPVHVHADDLLASAGYWAASAASRISVNAIGQVGSIGVVAVVEDTSAAASAQGVVVHVVSTGDHKGAFTPGSPVTEDHLAELQATVDGINVFFLAAVAKGRHLSAAQVAKAADGRVFFADEALKLGLVDAVQPLEKSLADLRKAWASYTPVAKGGGPRSRAQLALDIEAAHG